MLSGGGHVERYSGFSADLKGSQDIDRWSLQKAAPLPNCAGTLVTKQGQASTGRLAKASTYSVKSNLARRANWLILPTGISSKWHKGFCASTISHLN